VSSVKGTRRTKGIKIEEMEEKKMNKEVRNKLLDLVRGCDKKEMTCARCFSDRETGLVFCGSKINRDLSEKEMEELARLFAKKLNEK